MDDLNKTLTKIQIDIAAIRTDLNYHIKRTDVLESEVKEWRRDIEPVQKHVTFINSLGKLLAFLAIVGTAVAAIISIL